MKKQIYISANWKEIYEYLKSKGESLRNISKKIDSNFKNNVYSNYNMKLDSFRKLQDMMEYKIDFKKISHKDRYQSYTFTKNKATAEAIGIILGDGYIGERDVVISLNSLKERKYITHVNRLLEKTFLHKPSNSQAKDTNTHRIVYTRKGIVDELLNLGLHKGNKVKNQVGVPLWIKENRELSTACMKGLFDTDGSIYFHIRRNTRTKNIELNFSNASKPLLHFFADFCIREGIIPKGNFRKNGTELFIYSRKDVIRFAELIQSEKIKNFLESHNLNYGSLRKTLRY